MAQPEQLDLLEWAETRPTAEVVDIVDQIALRIWYRRYWPKPQNPCQQPINLPERKRGAA
ncbi:hypothetical protein ACQKP1_15935 [Allorhizobium sp. NPDC080224]|uniref:hypothetical protein n=1 Tax=Allorhizobium sp. NPDC080224 TaxID=3390547 RepID=UPI003D03BF5B